MPGLPLRSMVKARRMSSGVRDTERSRVAANFANFANEGPAVRIHLPPAESHANSHGDDALILLGGQLANNQTENGDP